MDEVMLDEDENLLVEHDDLITPNFEYGFEEDNDVTAIDAYLGSDYAKQVYSLQIVPEEDDIYTIVEKDGAPKSIAFNGINTWDTWWLIPSSRPVINPPGFKSNYIEIPGMDGSIDISTVLTGGYPTYSNRTGSIEYYVMREYDEYYCICQLHAAEKHRYIRICYFHYVYRNVVRLCFDRTSCG